MKRSFVISYLSIYARNTRSLINKSLSRKSSTTTFKDLIVDILIAEKPIVEPLIILLVSKLVLEIEYIFRNYYFTIIYISWKLVEKKKKSYTNIDYTITIANRTSILATSKVKINSV